MAIRARPRFIPGVYNFCDRWCERCRFQDRCRVNAERLRLTAAVEAGVDPQTVEPDDFDEPPPAPDNEGVRAWLDALTVAQSREDTEETARIEAQLAQANGLTEADALVRLAKDYRDLARPIVDALLPACRAHEDANAQLALETISHQSWSIAAKTYRAVWGRFHDEIDAGSGACAPAEDDDDEDETEVRQSDSNGSAKVVRLLIGESRDAWTMLMRDERVAADGVPRRMIDQLSRLDREVTARFPHAMAFVRPGFDEVEIGTDEGLR